MKLEEKENLNSDSIRMMQTLTQNCKKLEEKIEIIENQRQDEEVKKYIDEINGLKTENKDLAKELG